MTTATASTSTLVGADSSTSPAPSGSASAPPTTAPPTTVEPTKSAIATSSTVGASGPRIVSVAFSGPNACPAADNPAHLPPPTVSISWKATGADSVYVAIDNVNGPWQTGLPLVGSISDLPYGCPGTHTYFVVAVKGAQKVVKSKAFTTT
jgi:hypothetical protein